jgi:hypothetical protein
MALALLRWNLKESLWGDTPHAPRAWGSALYEPPIDAECMAFVRKPIRRLPGPKSERAWG